MDRTLSVIFGKLGDYKICKTCNTINYYENEKCHNCEKAIFDSSRDAVKKYLDSEYHYYMDELGYTEKEVDNIYVDV